MSSVRLQAVSARRNGVPIFDPVDLELKEPVAVEIVGPNGAGKTTLLRTLAGLYQQYDGQFTLPSTLYQGHRLGLDELDSVVENLLFHQRLDRQHGRPFNKPQTEKALRKALSKVGMLRHGLTQLGRLSQGQQRRVCMARWLLSDRPVWLLDEPLTALDEAGQTLLAKLLDAHVAAGRWVIYSSHSPIPLAHKVTLPMQART